MLVINNTAVRVAIIITFLFMCSCACVKFIKGKNRVRREKENRFENH